MKLFWKIAQVQGKNTFKIFFFVSSSYLLTIYKLTIFGPKKYNCAQYIKTQEDQKFSKNSDKRQFEIRPTDKREE